MEEALAIAVDRLNKATNAEAVILFGSRARGDHSPDSDWDVCVVLPDDTPAGTFDSIKLGRIVRGLGISIQVYPLRKRILLEKRRDVNSMSHDIVADGIVLSGDEGLVARSSVP